MIKVQYCYDGEFHMMDTATMRPAPRGIILRGAPKPRPAILKRNMSIVSYQVDRKFFFLNLDDWKPAFTKGRVLTSPRHISRAASLRQLREDEASEARGLAMMAGDMEFFG